MLCSHRPQETRKLLRCRPSSFRQRLLVQRESMISVALRMLRFSARLRTYDDTKILTHPHFAVEPLKGKIDGAGAAYRCRVKVQDMQSEARVTGARVRNILPAVRPPMDSRRAWYGDDEVYSRCNSTNRRMRAPDSVFVLWAMSAIAIPKRSRPVEWISQME